MSPSINMRRSKCADLYREVVDKVQVLLRSFSDYVDPASFDHDIAEVLTSDLKAILREMRDECFE
jgi:hypothetical protein